MQRMMRCVEISFEEKYTHPMQQWTPLHFACSNNHAEVERLLLEKGADIHAKNEVSMSV